MGKTQQKCEKCKHHKLDGTKIIEAVKTKTSFLAKKPPTSPGCGENQVSFSLNKTYVCMTLISAK
jgi:hypothetical protein